MTKQRTKQNTALWVVLALALALRLALALVTEGYPYDMSCFVAWGDKLAAQGPAAFYSEGYFADYPPGYLWVLGLVGAVRAALGIAYESRWTYLLLALVPSVCDCVSAALVYAVARRGTVGRQMALVLAAFTAFDPLLLFDTAIWKQIDGAFTLPLLLCFLLLEQRRYLPAAVWFGLALAIKPQALLFGPVLAACFLAGIAVEQDRLRAFGRCFGGAALALLVPLLTGIPFFGLARLGPRLVEKYTDTMSGYPYASINAFNWFAALGGNWKSLSEPALFGMSWQQLGWVHILLVTAGLAYFAVCSSRSGRFSPLLLAAYYGIGIFTLSHCMHERYMVPGVLLTLLAAARWNDIRLYAAGVGLSLTGFINLAAVYSLTGTEDEWLTSATSATVAILTGLGETVCFVLLLFAVWDITRHGHTLALPAGRVNAAATPDGQPAWTRREVGALLALTAATAVLSFAYLGSRTAPQQPLDATNTALTETVTLQGNAVSLWVYPGVSFGGRMTVTDAQGNTVFEKELDYGTCFSWTANAVTAAAGQSLTVTVQNAQMFELAFRDAAGGLVPTVGGGALFDEQDAVPDAISQFNSMYFDEIYHGRTGYEQLHRMPVYETTHPPLGKDLIMLGIALFGMTGFGWRFSGTLFGVLLVPLAWCFVRRLTRRPGAAATAGVLLALAKWTGIDAGAGRAVLYLGVLWARRQQGRPGFWAEFRLAALGGVLFYVVLPLCIYVASYLPYWWRQPDFSLGDWWRCQLSMYSYHATLKATHPFESRWYTWLLGLRPVWYYRNGSLPYGMKASIAGMAGPVIWVVGLAALVGLFWHQVSGRGSRQGAAVLILYGTQLIPWMLVTRCTFLYHYFPSSMFCLAALALVLARMRQRDWARWLAAGLCAAAAVLFAVYYPALSGLPIPAWWADALEVLPSFGFY